MPAQLANVHVHHTTPLRLDRAMRWGVWLLPLHALLFLWGTRERQPSPSTEFGEWAAFVSTDEFRWAHLVASIGGQAAGMIGTAALGLLVLRGAGIGRSALGLLLHLTGSSLMLSGFGVAAFAQPAIGELYGDRPRIAEEMYHAVYSPTVFVVLLTGLALFSASTVATGAALASSAVVPRWLGRLYAVTGPVFGVLGFLFGIFQTIGALARAAASALAANALLGRPRSPAPPSGATRQ